MSTPAFNFASFQPLFDRAAQAVDFRLSRMPTEAAQADRAYKEWLLSKQTERGMDQMRFAEEVRGRQANEALNRETLHWNTLPQRQMYDVANNMYGAGVHHYGAYGTNIAGTGYGGSSPGGVEGAKLPPIPYSPSSAPAFGPRGGATVNVNAGGGGGAANYYSAMGGGASTGSFGRGSNFEVPSYWNTETSGNAEDDEKRGRR